MAILTSSARVSRRLHEIRSSVRLDGNSTASLFGGLFRRRLGAPDGRLRVKIAKIGKVKVIVHAVHIVVVVVHLGIPGTAAGGCHAHTGAATDTTILGGRETSSRLMRCGTRAAGKGMGLIKRRLSSSTATVVVVISSKARASKRLVKGIVTAVVWW